MFAQGMPRTGPNDRFEVLFFGKYIPLHGVETIIRAAKVLEPHSRIRVTMLGTGQQRAQADALAAELDLTAVRFVDWVPYADLPAIIAAADLCLGIFGTGEKASRVVPNKAYQAIAAGCPLITADTPAARTGLLRDGLTGAVLVPPGDASALASAILEIGQKPERWMAAAHDGHEQYLRHYRSVLIGEQVAGIVRDMRPSQSEPRARVGGQRHAGP
jgi:glycosyltransferase involved in cell wall biosynthesis